MKILILNPTHALTDMYKNIQTDNIILTNKHTHTQTHTNTQKHTHIHTQTYKHTHKTKTLQIYVIQNIKKIEMKHTHL